MQSRSARTVTQTVLMPTPWVSGSQGMPGKAHLQKDDVEHIFNAVK